MPKQKINWEALRNDLCMYCEKYHTLFYEKFPFGGPSLHFHERALSATGNNKIEMIYAMLVSWGMHRMGGGAQMHAFSTFKNSITKQNGKIAEIADKISTNNFSYSEMKDLFESIEPMKSRKKLVGHSKVLAHFFPDVVSPIDGEYTLQFTFGIGRKNLPSNFGEFEFFEQFHSRLVKPLINDAGFKIKCENWIHLSSRGNYPWDTSLPKIIDNLIIGKMYGEKAQRRKGELIPYKP